MARTRSIASLPCKIVLGDVIQTSFQEILLSSGVFRRETASGFYPWGNVVSPRERAHHIAPRLFFMFLFLIYIHDSATLHNLSPGMFHWTPKKQITFDFFVLCHTFDEWIRINNYVTIIYICKKSIISKIRKIDGRLKLREGALWWCSLSWLLDVRCYVISPWTLSLSLHGCHRCKP